MSSAEPQTYGGASLAARYASFVKLPHTLFALPFAGVGAVFGSFVAPDAIAGGTLLWIVIAFAAARFAAMGFNRIVDRRYDALNPRTAARELPAGTLTVTQAWAAVVVSAALFLGAAWLLNPLCGLLAPIALIWIFFYSYTKRFTSLAHLVLGLALGIAPVGAYLAVTGAWSEPWWALLLLAGAIMLWVAGFDIIYALQDVDFDRTHALRSIPASLGVANALRLARALHALSVLCMGALWLIDWIPLGVFYLAAVVVMAVLLHFGHAQVGRPDAPTLDIRRIDRAFFRTNVTVSMSFFALTLADRLWS